MRILKKAFLTLFFLRLLFSATLAMSLPNTFVYLHDIAPDIIQEIRYAGDHNFIGRPIKGYQASQCILTQTAANALVQIQAELVNVGLSLKVYDCYRPQTAVNDFIEWSEDPDQHQMKAEFYPMISKTDLFTLDYVAKKSGHSRGSTVDLTIVPLHSLDQAHYSSGDKLTACFADYNTRFRDNSIDMGTGFDCMDISSHPLNKSVSAIAYHHRMLLRELMIKYGFAPYESEWWHFTLKNELYPNTYFDFAVS